MPVERACMGKGAASQRAEAMGAPKCCWLQVVLVGPCLSPGTGLGRAHRHCLAEKAEEQELPVVEHKLASEQPHLCPASNAGPSWLRAASPCCQPPARQQAPHPLPRLGAGRREVGPRCASAEQPGSPRLPVSSACLSLC